LNVPESKRLGSREKWNNTFAKFHFANIIKAIDAHTPAARRRNNCLAAFASFCARLGTSSNGPLKVVTTLSQQLAGMACSFSSQQSITHVAVARPHYLDLEGNAVSEGSADCRLHQRALWMHTPAINRILGAVARPAVALATRRKKARWRQSQERSQWRQSLRAPAGTPPPSGDLHEPTPEQTAVIADCIG